MMRLRGGSINIREDYAKLRQSIHEGQTMDMDDAADDEDVLENPEANMTKS